jgi:hypothetical protein
MPACFFEDDASTLLLASRERILRGAGTVCSLPESDKSNSPREGVQGRDELSLAFSSQASRGGLFALRPPLAINQSIEDKQGEGSEVK